MFDLVCRNVESCIQDLVGFSSWSAVVPIFTPWGLGEPPSISSRGEMVTVRFLFACNPRTSPFFLSLFSFLFFSWLMARKKNMVQFIALLVCPSLYGFAWTVSVLILQTNINCLDPFWNRLFFFLRQDANSPFKMQMFHAYWCEMCVVPLKVRERDGMLFLLLCGGRRRCWQEEEERRFLCSYSYSRLPILSYQGLT